MAMEEDLRALLAADDDVAAAAPGGIDWGLRPTGAGACAIGLARASGGRAYHFQGRDSLTRPLVDISCWGATYGEAKRLARLVEAALVPGGPFLGFFVEDDTDTHEPGHGLVEVFYRTRLGVRVLHKPVTT